MREASASARGTRTHRAALLFLLGMAACGDRMPAGESGAEQPVYGGTLVIAGAGDLGGMNGFIANEAYTQDFLLHALFLPLVRLTANNDFEPALAESWNWEGDTAVTFHLRRDVRWHDGVTTSAHDVVFTFDRSRDPATAYPNQSDLMQYKSATASDSFTVRMTLEPHMDPMLTMAFLPIMPRHALDSVAPQRLAQAAFNRAPVGNGPFRFVEYRANDRWVFAANDSFPASLGGRPYIDRVIWRVIPENAAQVTELLTGAADLILIPRAEDFARFDELPDVRGVVKPSAQYHFIGWNGKRPLLGDTRVRRALAMAIDRAEILQTLRGGHGELAAGPVAPFHWAFPDSVRPLPFDTAASRELLAEAGVRDTNGDGKVEGPGGRPFTIELKTQANNAFQSDVAQMIQADLAAIGVTMTIRPTEWLTLISDISGRQRNFDAVLMGWNADHRINIRDLFHSAALGGSFQLASYSNPQLDAELDTLARITDRATAAPHYARVQSILRDDQPWTLLYYVPNLYGMRDRVRGSVMDVRGAFVNLQKWWLAGGEASETATSHGN